MSETTTPATNSPVESMAAVTHDRVRRKVRALVMPIRQRVSKDESGEEPGSQDGQSFQDLLRELEKRDNIIEPPFDPFALSLFRENNSEMSQVVDAMVTNVVGFGQVILPYPDVADLGDEHPEAGAIEAEWETFDEFLKYGNWDGSSLTLLRRAQRQDYEETGNSFLELIVNSQGAILGVKHAPSYLIRLSTRDNQVTTYRETRIVGRATKRRVEVRTKNKRFRRYAMLDIYGNRGQVIWFKEFGDPRNISRSTGEVIKPEDLAKATRKKDIANPMFHRRIYAPRSPYGIPRYIGNMLALLGARAAEEINYTTFRNNQVPSMMILVANGQLTNETIERIQEFSSSHIQGDSNYSKFLIIEGEPDDIIDADKPGGSFMKLDVKPLTSEQRDDALFVKYEEANADKIRRCWRLPAMFVGGVKDMNRASAETAKGITEEQVFAPERSEEDWDWNRILVSMGMHFHEMRTGSPNVSRDEDLIAIMKESERSGAMTPRIAHAFLEDVVGKKLPAIDESKVEMDVPFSLQMAEIVKNQAKPNEVGQQVTALKSLTNTGIGFQLVDAHQFIDMLSGEVETLDVEATKALPTVGPTALVYGNGIIGYAIIGSSTQVDSVIRYEVESVVPVGYAEVQKDMLVMQCL